MFQVFLPQQVQCRAPRAGTGFVTTTAWLRVGHLTLACTANSAFPRDGGREKNYGFVNNAVSSARRDDSNLKVFSC